MLTLYDSGFAGRVRAFHQLLDVSPSFRQLFLDDPSGTTGQWFFPDTPVSSGTLSSHNRLVYALLGNARFREWADTYQRSLLTDALAAEADLAPEEAMRMAVATIDKKKIYSDLADAIPQFIDREIAFSLLSHGSIEEDLVASENMAAQLAKPNLEPVLVLLLLVVVAIYTIIPVSGLEHDVVPSFGISRDSLQRVARVMTSAIQERADSLRDTQ